MTTRISTQALHIRTVGDITRLQAGLAETQKQISSGVKTDSFMVLGTDINRAQDLEASVNATKRFRDNNSVALTRLKSMDLAASQIQDVASGLASALITENSPSSEVFDLGEFARNALKQVESALNVTQAGRSLFAGSKTDQPAVGDLVLTNNVVGGVTNADYYNGDAFLASVQASDTLNVEYGITAGDQAFQDIIGALHKAIELDESGGETNSAQADALLQSAIQGLAGVRTKINNDIVTLNETNDQHDRVQVQLNDALSKLMGTDIVGASIESALNEATLTATMQIFGRMSSLSLVDFLR